MNTITIDNTDWIMRLIAPLSEDTKISIINRITAMMMKKDRKEKKQADMSFFDGLSNAWDDGTPAENVIEQIYNARTSGETRKIIEF